MSAPLIQYRPDAALRLLEDGRLEQLRPDLESARQEVLVDVDLWQTRGDVPEAKQPLDAGFIQWPEELLQNMREQGPDSLVSRIEASAARLRDIADSVVVLGIGGSYMGMRALFEALNSRVHNELDREARGGIPRIYFDGWNVDSDHQKALLELLQKRAESGQGPESRTAVIVISKSGGTLETAAAFRLYRAFLERNFGDEARNLIVPVTGDSGRLRDLSEAAGYPDVFSIPDGIGGRFSVLTAVGLLPAAVAGINIRRLLQGAADITENFREAACGENPVLDYTGVCHVFEQDRGCDIRVLSTWGNRLESVGLWYDQLLSESLGKHERGATPITGVNTRDLHSRGQQHQEGRRDKLITNLIPGAPTGSPLAIPEHALDDDRLNQLAGCEFPRVLQAALDGTNQAYADVERPTADLCLPTINEHSLGQVFQMLMLATVLEGRLVGTNPYGQPGVEAYKKNMQANLGL